MKREVRKGRNEPMIGLRLISNTINISSYRRYLKNSSGRSRALSPRKSLRVPEVSFFAVVVLVAYKPPEWPDKCLFKVHT